MLIFILGAVFAAKHVLCRRASEKTRLVEEVNILRSLDHPNIMKLYRSLQVKVLLYVICKVPF